MRSRLNLTNQSVIRDIMRKFGFSFSKALGQNFLINPSVCPRIAQLGTDPGRPVGVIEIGTGFGVLTTELSKVAEKVVAVEIDSRLIPVLEYTLADCPNVKVINADVLKIDLLEVVRNEFPGMDVYVCANLPYYITSPIIMSLLEQRLPVQAITVMVQKEAAARICAEPGSRDVGAISIAVRYFSRPRILFSVSRGSFMPAPNVDSCVVRMDVGSDTPKGVEDEAYFFRVVRSAFAQRRKTLVNTLSASLGCKKASVAAALAQAGLKPSARAEELHIEEFVLLANAMRKEELKR